MKVPCALCEVMAESPRLTQNSIGLMTSIPELIARATERLDAGEGSEAHVIIPACPEHVVDVYRGRIEGASMAWRMASAAR